MTRLILNPVMLFSLCICLSSVVAAHPEDEFCSDASMDPLLCAELASLDASVSTSVVSTPIVVQRNVLETLGLYIAIGIKHILPGGVDHLLFVLALLISISDIRKLCLQISVFTFAHTLTFGLVLFSSIAFPTRVVEILIAATIVYVGIENIFCNKPLPWRTGLIFLFGLLHGLGFASALRETGLAQTHVVWSLVGFNLGVEIAQLAFAFVVFTALYFLMKKSGYRKFIKIPVSMLISLIASWWLVERILAL